MTGSSFNFGRYNSADDWGIRVIAHDFLFPPKRARKITIPHRDGAYDFGAENYDERTLRLECTLERRTTRAALREIVYILCQKRQIRLWNEPQKYYIGELYDPGEILDYPMESGREFELNFVCEPFAYLDAEAAPVATGHNTVPYDGTANAPCVITLTNHNSYPISNVTVSVAKRRT